VLAKDGTPAGGRPSLFAAPLVQDRNAPPVRWIGLTTPAASAMDAYGGLRASWQMTQGDGFPDPQPHPNCQS